MSSSLSTSQVADEKETTSQVPITWQKSVMDDAKITALEKNGVLPSHDVLPRRPAAGETSPTPQADEVVVFGEFFERGFSIPVHPFLRRLLDFYGLELHHLNPNGMLHISCFIVTCEAYLGIEPDIFLWRRLFLCKVQPSKAKPAIVGGAGFQLRSGAKYFQIPFKSSLKGWHSNWFYASNPASSLPSFTGQLPNSENPCWRKALTKDEIKALDKPLNLLQKALECGLSGVVTSHLFISRRVQPAKLREHPLSLYSGEEDPTRESAEPLSEKEITARLEDLFATGTDLSMSNRPAPLGATIPLPLVSNGCHLFLLAYSYHLLLNHCAASRSLRSQWACPSTLNPDLTPAKDEVVEKKEPPAKRRKLITSRGTRSSPRQAKPLTQQPGSQKKTPTSKGKTVQPSTLAGATKAKPTGAFRPGSLFDSLPTSDE